MERVVRIGRRATGVAGGVSGVKAGRGGKVWDSSVSSWAWPEPSLLFADDGAAASAAAVRMVLTGRGGMAVRDEDAGRYVMATAERRPFFLSLFCVTKATVTSPSSPPMTLAAIGILTTVLRPVCRGSCHRWSVVTLPCSKYRQL